MTILNIKRWAPGIVCDVNVMQVTSKIRKSNNFREKIKEYKNMDFTDAIYVSQYHVIRWEYKTDFVGFRNKHVCYTINEKVWFEIEESIFKLSSKIK